MKMNTNLLRLWSDKLNNEFDDEVDVCNVDDAISDSEETKEMLVFVVSLLSVI
jgi:hypothetical protein